MDGTVFEHFCADVLRANGYHVEHLGQPGDYGADLVIASQSGRAVVQAKRYVGNVGVEAVQQAAAARAHYRAGRAIVLTNSYFTPRAHVLARSNAVDLWDRNVLISLAARMYALPSPSTPSLLVRQVASGIAVISRMLLVLLVIIGELLQASTSTRGKGPTRRRSTTRRRRR